MFVSVFVGLIGIFYARNILMLMGADEIVLETGETYTRLMFGGCFTIVFLFLVNAIFRGAGDASLAMRALTLANCINIVLDPCLIYGYGPFPEFGLTGAAVATNIGRGIGMLYGLYYLCSGRGRIHLQLQHLKIQIPVVISLLRISVGGVSQFLVATASWVFLMQIVSGFGSEAVAGYTIAVRVVMFSILPAWGLSNAAATLVGQNLGGRITRARRSYGLENREIQLDLYGHCLRVDVAVHPSDRRILYPGAGGCGLCRVMPAHICRGIRGLGRRHGHHPGLQWCR